MRWINLFVITLDGCCFRPMHSCSLWIHDHDSPFYLFFHIVFVLDNRSWICAALLCEVKDRSIVTMTSCGRQCDLSYVLLPNTYRMYGLLIDSSPVAIYRPRLAL